MTKDSRLKKFSVFDIDGKLIGEYETEQEIAIALHTNIANVQQATTDETILEEKFYVFKNRINPQPDK